MSKYSISDIYSKEDYFEAIFQIRPNDKDVINFFKEKIARNKVFISKEIKKKFGTDYYLTSRKLAVIIGKRMKKKFRGETKVSKQLYSRSRMTSKLIYRLTICFRLKNEED